MTKEKISEREGGGERSETGSEAGYFYQNPFNPESPAKFYFWLGEDGEAVSSGDVSVRGLESVDEPTFDFSTGR